MRFFIALSISLAILFWIHFHFCINIIQDLIQKDFFLKLISTPTVFVFWRFNCKIPVISAYIIVFLSKIISLLLLFEYSAKSFILRVHFILISFIYEMLKNIIIIRVLFEISWMLCTGEKKIIKYFYLLIMIPILNFQK